MIALETWSREKYVVWFGFYGKPIFSSHKFTENGRLMWWRCNERAACQRMLQAVRKWSNGHTWWWSRVSVQRIKNGCEGSTSRGTDFGWSQIAQWRKSLFVDGCEWKNPIYTATDSFKPLPRCGICISVFWDCTKNSMSVEYLSYVWRFNKFSFNV